MADINKIQIIKYAPPPPQLPILGKVDPLEVCFSDARIMLPL